VFIQTLVDVMKKIINHYHFEEVLLFLKNEMGKKRASLCHEDKIVHGIQQMPSVVSQLRGRIIFGTD